MSQSHHELTVHSRHTPYLSQQLPSSAKKKICRLGNKLISSFTHRQYTQQYYPSFLSFNIFQLSLIPRFSEINYYCHYIEMALVVGLLILDILCWRTQPDMNYFNLKLIVLERTIYSLQMIILFVRSAGPSQIEPRMQSFLTSISLFEIKAYTGRSTKKA